MKAILTLAGKELRDLFASPIAYVFLVLFLFLAFWLFFFNPGNIFALGQLDLRGFFASLPLLFVFFLPSLTMSQWANERRLGTFEILTTLPVSDFQLILGKFLSALAFLAIVVLFTLPLPISVAALGTIDIGQVVASYIGTIVLGAAYLSLGLFVSSLTRDQIVAFLISVTVLFLLYALAGPLVTGYLPEPLIPMVQFLSFNERFESIARGVLDSRDIVYFLSVTGLFIYLNTVSLTVRRV